MMINFQIFADYDTCTSNPCQNGAECAFEHPNYACICIEGYTGVNCETDIDECGSNPNCGHGVCIDTLNSFYCRCDDGYGCERCDKLVSPASGLCQFRWFSYCWVVFCTGFRYKFTWHITLDIGCIIYSLLDESLCMLTTVWDMHWNDKI